MVRLHPIAYARILIQPISGHELTRTTSASLAPQARRNQPHSTLTSSLDTAAATMTTSITSSHPHLHGHVLCIILLIILCSLTTISSSCMGEQIRIPLTRHDGPHRLRTTAVSHPYSSKALELYSDPSSPVSLYNFYNRMYVGDVQIGTPSKSFSLVFDTGSADLWVFAAASQKPTLDYIHYYDYKQSSTAKVTTEAWSIQYGKGSSSGNLVSDTVSLANKTASSFTFAQASTYSDDFESSQMPLDGLLGLAFSKVNSAGGPMLLDSLQSQGRIRDRVFSFYFTTDNPTGSEFVLGSPDMTLARGNITYLDVTSDTGMWILSMQAVNVADQASSYCPDGCGVLMDTGTSFIGMPTAAFNDFAQRVSNARADCYLDSYAGLIRCTNPTPDGLPSIGFSIQGSLFTLTGSQYFQVENDRGVLGLMAVDVSSSRSSFWILGDTFLKTYYTVFDMDQKRIGIVGAKPGVPWEGPSTSSPFSTFGWQLILLLVAIVIFVGLIGCCCLSCLRFFGIGSRGRPASPPSSGSTPYLLHAQGPSANFSSERAQRRMTPPRQFSYATNPRQPTMTTVPGGPTIAHPMATYPGSQFAQEFYGAGAV